MKIIFLIPSLRAGGSERQFLILAKSLINKGINVEFITYSKKKFYNAEKIVIHNINKKYKIDIFFLIRLISKVKKINGDLLITCYQGIFEGPLLWGRLVKLFIPKLRLFSCYRSSNFNHVSMIIEKLTHKLSEKLIVNNKIAKNKLKNLLGERGFSEKIIMINNIADNQNFYEFDEISKKKYRKKFFPKQYKKYIFCILGSYISVKNHAFILKSIKYLKKDIIEKKLYFTMHGSKDSINSTYSFCREYIDNNNLNKFCSINGQEKNINTLLNSVDCLILPSLSEGSPNVVIESIMTKTPVLISKTSNHSKLIVNGENGFEFDINNIKDFEKSIKDVMSVDFKYNKINNFLENYEKNKITIKYLQAFNFYE